MSALLTYAYDKNKILVHIDAVENGNRCNCFCPNCGAPLDAKNSGEIREHHFAHSRGFLECEGAYESMLHHLAKDIIKETGCIMLPESENEHFPSGIIQLRDIEIEKLDNEYSIRPDAEGIMPNGERLLIEFRVSHKVDKKKRYTIIEKGLKCIEIDIRWLEINKEKLKHLLVNTTEYRKWVKPSLKPESKDGFSSYYQRNKYQLEAIDFIKNTYDNIDLIVFPGAHNHSLKNNHYDICEPHANYNGYKSDILLYRSTSMNKGYISINIRGRRRNYGQRIPPDLRMIDIIIRDEKDLRNLKMQRGQIYGEYIGAWFGNKSYIYEY